MLRLLQDRRHRGSDGCTDRGHGSVRLIVNGREHRRAVHTLWNFERNGSAAGVHHHTARCDLLQCRVGGFRVRRVFVNTQPSLSYAEPV